MNWAQRRKSNYRSNSVFPTLKKATLKALDFLAIKQDLSTEIKYLSIKQNSPSTRSSPSLMLCRQMPNEKCCRKSDIFSDVLAFKQYIPKEMKWPSVEKKCHPQKLILHHRSHGYTYANAQNIQLLL